LAVRTVVFPGKADLPIGEREQPAIGDGDAMGVAAEIGQHLFGASERWLGVDHPVEALEFAQATCEGLRFGKISEIGEEPWLAGPEGVLQLLQEQPAEQPREDAHRDEEPERQATQRVAVEGYAPRAGGAYDSHHWTTLKAEIKSAAIEQH